MISTIHWWVASEEGMVIDIRLVTLTLFWLYSVEGDQHHRLVSCIWGRYGALHKVSYSPLAFGYILWKMISKIDRWVASEEGMVPSICLVTSTCFWLYSVEVSQHHGLLGCIWGRYDVLHKFSYSLIAFGYILWIVISTIDWWVASEKGMVQCIRLITLTLLLLIFNGRWSAPYIGELHLRKVWWLT